MRITDVSSYCMRFLTLDYYFALSHRDNQRRPLADVTNFTTTGNCQNPSVRYDMPTLFQMSHRILTQQRFCKWSVSTQKTSCKFYVPTLSVMDSFPIMKSVEINENLSYAIDVANIHCPVESFHPEFPPMPLLDFRSVEALLLAVESKCLCLGISNVQYQPFEPEIFGADGTVKGRSRYVWAASKPDDKKKVYFSNECLGLISSTASKKTC